MTKPVYLDYAAATPLDPAVLADMQPYFSEQFYNPSALYQAAQHVSAAVRDARSRVAGVLGVKSSEVFFTAGGTESDNMAIHGVMQGHTNGHVVVSAIEHDAVLEPAKQYAHTAVAPQKNGIIDPAAVTAAVRDDTVLVSIMYVNNEVGTVQPIKQIAQALQRVRDDRRTRGIAAPLYFHTDACQAANYLSLQPHRLGVDLMTLNGGKIYGPKQSGVLIVKTGTILQPLMRGGGQERGLRSGTENVASIVGFTRALEIAQSMRQTETVRVSQLQHVLLSRLGELPGVTITATTKHRIPNNVHITVDGFDNERLLYELDNAGMMAAAGSACSASSDTPSHVLGALGCSDSQARSSLRFTLGRQTTESDIERVATVLRGLLGEPQ